MSYIYYKHGFYFLYRSTGWFGGGGKTHCPIALWFLGLVESRLFVLSPVPEQNQTSNAVSIKYNVMQISIHWVWRTPFNIANESNSNRVQNNTTKDKSNTFPFPQKLSVYNPLLKDRGRASLWENGQACILAAPSLLTPPHTISKIKL